MHNGALRDIKYLNYCAGAADSPGPPLVQRDWYCPVLPHPLHAVAHPPGPHPGGHHLQIQVQPMTELLTIAEPIAEQLAYSLANNRAAILQL